MNEDNLPSEDIAPPRAEPLSEAKETQINRMAGCTKMGGCLLIILIGIALSVVIYRVWLKAEDPAQIRLQTERTQTKAAMKDIQVASAHFRAEYSCFPLPGLSGEKSPDVTFESRGRWLDALLANEPELNRRNIKFLDVSLAGSHGGLKWENRESVLIDRWGKPYAVIFDTDLDNTIANPEAKAGNLSSTIPEKINAAVAIYSGGPDGNLDTWEDNICSWR